MGNANGRAGENGGGEYPPRQPDGGDFVAGFGGRSRAPSMDLMENSTPPDSPGRSQSPLLFAPQVPVAPLQREPEIQPVFNQLWTNHLHGPVDATFNAPSEQGIPTMITWNYGGKDVAVAGSWDNWMSRRTLQRTGKDHSILLVLPSGVYQYRFIVDGEWRYIPDLPCITDEVGHVTNLLDVQDSMPENLESVAEFEPPPSPDSSYGQPFPLDEDFSKEPFTVPSQLHLTILGMQDPPDATSSSKPQHVVLNHLFIEKGWAPHSLVALGLTHRFQSKYVTVVLYKPLTR
ncbi:galactose metabolism-related protein [Asimina triloba]